MIIVKRIVFGIGVMGVILSGYSQSGGNMLDGIGETAMRCRYLFDTDTKDWSRNGLHGQVEGSATFVSVEPFGPVLSLAGDGHAKVSLPWRSLGHETSFTIMGWVFFTASTINQYLLDYQMHRGARLTMSNSAKESCELSFQCKGAQTLQIHAPPIAPNHWTHFAIVVDRAESKMSLFMDGISMGDAPLCITPMAADDQAFKKGYLYLGQGGSPETANKQTYLHDFRMYSVPISANQLMHIVKAARGVDAPVVNEPVQDAPWLHAHDHSLPLYNQFLVEVADIRVVTQVGEVPRLPRFVKGAYKDGVVGPPVRVLWPAPKDNSQWLKAGTYKVTGAVTGTSHAPQATVQVVEAGAEKPKKLLQSFRLDQVILNPDQQAQPTKFMENRDQFLEALSQTNPDDFLYMFRNTFGVQQPAGAKPLGVWDSQEIKLRGHATGHYLTAMAQAYASTRYDKALNETFAQKMEVMVNELHKLSQLSGRPSVVGGPFVSDPAKVPPASGKRGYDSDLSKENIRTDSWNWGRGFISAYPPDQFIMLEKGANYGTGQSQVWAPYYTLHKIIAGLLDVYEISGNNLALQVATGMADWVHVRLSQLPAETLIKMWNTYIAGEYGGMNEVLARLSILTNEPKYLKTAQLFDNVRVFFGDARHSHGLAKNVDLFRGLHANQHIPQMVGALATYQSSGIADYYHIADNFWYKAVMDYSYSIGGVAGARNPANAECFTSEPATLYANGLSKHGQNETCATYNMLKLTQSLFHYNPSAQLMDYYERGLYNHILASVAAHSPANTYHVPLTPGAIKQFSNENMSGFTCCNGTALESNTKLQKNIYHKQLNEDELYVNLFIPSTLSWEEKNMVVEQKTSFPRAQNTTLILKGNAKFALKIRVPKWADAGFAVKVNGVSQQVIAVPGTYLSMHRSWKDGDVIQIDMPFGFHLMPVMDQPHIASLFYGPILLAAQESAPRTAWRKVTLDATDLGKTITGDPSTLNFEIDGIKFKPFYESYEHHSVYLDVHLKHEVITH